MVVFCLASCSFRCHAQFVLLVVCEKHPERIESTGSFDSIGAHLAVTGGDSKKSLRFITHDTA